MKPIRGLLSLLTAYAAWVLVKGHYDKKKWWKKTKKTSDKDSILEQANDAGRDFLDTHRQIFEDLKSEYWTDTNKKLFQSKKQDLVNFFDLVKAEIVETAQKLKDEGFNKTDIDEKIASIYEEKKSLLKKLGATPVGQAAQKKLKEIRWKKTKKSPAKKST